ncbi:MAG: hypothetical protein MN733_21240 [Nitrososphaera sp.]|nr:hypothetical protein [Nitrososphaera sp.]
MNEKSVQRAKAQESVFVSASQVNMNPSENVQILLKEYDTLPAEILHRIGHRFAFLSLIGAAGTYAFFTKPTAYQTVVLIISATIASWVTSRSVRFLTAWAGIMKTLVFSSRASISQAQRKRQTSASRHAVFTLNRHILARWSGSSRNSLPYSSHDSG